MLTFLLKRLLQLVPTLFFVSVIIFSLLHLLPGDPALVMAGEEHDPAVIEQIRHQYHLDQPLLVQYVYWVSGILHGDLGQSIRWSDSVEHLIAQALPVTTQLATMAIIIAFAIGVPAGIISAVTKGHGLGLRRQYLCFVGHFDAELLARHHDDLSVFGKTRLASGLGLRAADARIGKRASPPPSCRPSCSAIRSPRC